MATRKKGHVTDSIIRIPPNKYIHVLDNNENLRRIVEGPCTFVKKEHEILLKGPEDMIVLPPGNYCVVSNPVVRDEGGKPVLNKYGEYQIRQGREEIRQSEQFPEPFPLYPGEELEKPTTPYRIVETNMGLIIKALRDFDDKHAGDRWLFKGPGVYIPKIQEEIEKEISASIIKQNQALKIRTLRDTTVKGIKRKAGEVWLEREQGAYLPSVDEEIITSIEGKVLTDKKALHLKATANFKDHYGIERRAGEEWLVTKEMAEVHIRDVYEDIVGEIRLTTLARNQYCIVVNPVDAKGIPQFGKCELRRGEATFFLKPGESLKDGIQSARVLSEHQSLLLQAREDLKEDDEVKKSGMKWVVRGPREYIPPAEVSILEERESIPLDENEGIYVRNIKTGEVRIVKNTVYMLTSEEILWEKELSDEVEELLSFQASGSGFAPVFVSDSGDRSYAKKKPVAYKRNKTRAITFRAPHNSAVQLFDYKAKKSRIVFGPDLVILEPYEEITVLRLSGDVPKRENQLKNLALLLGPDFMTDQIIVETSDHARLYLRLAYSWKFDIDKSRPETYNNIFSVSDFVGEACKSLASRIRGAVSGETFEQFHKRSSEIIQQAVFKKDENGNRIPFLIKTNNLLITSVDIQGVEPVEESTRKSLEMSVKLSIDITTKTQEDKAKHEAERLEQQAKGERDKQAIDDEAEAEKKRIKLYQLQAESDSVETTGKALALARAKAEAAEIDGKAEVKQAELQVNALKITQQAELELAKSRYEAEILHKKAMIDLEVETNKKLAEIEAEKFQKTIESLGQKTLVEMARAGPETQAKLLKGLGLKGYMIIDAKNPINLFNTAQGMINAPVPPQNHMPE
eukprot:TRINITY_DN7686_c0_g1_i1.p1 TRINITY_DN7686_c0_g1~~TRINITY_DN7686_c0_g1_i1.p1  ORF type:complete len:856 (+),score=360.74 TRINITY_DN7686_c0_g1_i1:194-2761(+)